jgi:hypothetical protein
VCAVTCRFHPEKADIYPIAMHFAKNECANALMHGWKSVGLAQAFMLLAMYHNPARRWEEERPYVYAGLALRSAHALDRLDEKRLTEYQDRNRPECAHRSGGAAQERA